MSRDCDTGNECIALDQKELRNELRALTPDQRVLIIKEYERLAQELGVGMGEFNAFMLYFDKIED